MRHLRWLAVVGYNFPMSTNVPVRLEATVTGLVQGVSFRYYTMQQAQRLGLVGWVANQPDGSVRVVAEGPKAEIDAFVRFLHTGSPHAAVEQVSEQQLPATGEFSNFRIRVL